MDRRGDGRHPGRAAPGALAPRLPAPGRPRRRDPVARRRPLGPAPHRARQHRRSGSLGFFGPPRGGRRGRRPRRPRSATAWSRRPAAGASRPRRCARCWPRPTALGVRVRASVRPRQPRQHPGARQVRLHRAARRRRGRPPGDGPAAAPAAVAELPAAEVPVRPGPPRLVATDLDGTLVRSDGTRLGLHPRGAARARAARRAGRLRHRPPAALGRGGLRARRRARPGGRLERRPGVGRRPRTGRTSSARSTPRARARGLPAAPRGGAGHGVRGRDAARDRASSRLPGAAPGARRAAGAADLEELFDGPALKLLARHEELDAAGVLGRRRGRRRAAGW